MKEIYDYTHYKSYLLDFIQFHALHRKGIQSEMAKLAGCQPGYMTRALKGQADLSLEQAHKLAPLLGHNQDENEFFLLLVQAERAGTNDLKIFFSKQLQKKKQQMLDLKNRYKIQDKLTLEDKAIYYSSWIYGAIHALASVPHFNKKETIAQILGYPVSDIAEKIQFLVSTKILEMKEDGTLSIGTYRLHLPSDHPLISKHHMNWRLKAMECMEQKIGPTDLHYSSVISLSHQDADKVKVMLTKMLDEIKKIIASSTEERVATLSLDFFNFIKG